MILSREELIAEFGSVFEHSPWIAEAAFERGAFQGVGRSADGMIRLSEQEAERIHEAMCEAFRAVPKEKRLAVLKAHPDLAGRLQPGDMTDDSQAEQAGAGLDRLSEEERETFLDLNRRYQERFGHPFIVAVKGLTKRDILERFQQRIGNDAQEELDTAAREVERIAALRLRERVEEGGA